MYVKKRRKTMKITMNNQKKITLEEGYKDFFMKCNSKNLSEHTINYYRFEKERFGFNGR